MTPSWNDIFEAASAGNIAQLEALASLGANFNQMDSYNETLLEEVVFDLCESNQPFKYEVVQTFLKLGADPNYIGLQNEQSSPLVAATLRMDTEMLRVLLEGGANPNKVSGFFGDDLLYDWAVMDYHYNIYINPTGKDLPDTPTEEDKKDEDTWIQFLDRAAIKNNVRRPDYLFLLRSYGAKSITEIKLVD